MRQEARKKRQGRRSKEVRRKRQEYKEEGRRKGRIFFNFFIFILRKRQRGKDEEAMRKKPGLTGQKEGMPGR